jgi:hypothetical protein
VDWAVEMMGQPQHLRNLEGLVMICQAYLNSLVETEEQIAFFECILGDLHNVAMALLREINSATREEWQVH